MTMAEQSITLTARNAQLDELAQILKDHRARTIDLVATQHAIQATPEGRLAITAEPMLTDDGVITVTGDYGVTQIGHEGMADKLGVPPQYLRKLYEGRPDLWAGLVDGLLHGGGQPVEGNDGGAYQYPPDGRKHLLRLLRTDEGGGLLRAWLSNGYRIIDHLDVLIAAMGGIRDATGGDPEAIKVVGCDLSERRMYVKIAAPGVRVVAEQLLRDYRNPFGDGQVAAEGRGARWSLDQAFAAAAGEHRGYEPGAEPILFAGFVLSNSETGGGAFSLVPRILFQPCRNGLTLTVDALKQVHLGGRMEEGVIQWSQDTRRKQRDLVAAQARDAVKAYLSTDYLAAKVAELEEAAGRPVKGNPADVIAEVIKASQLPAGLIDDVVGFFTRGGQMTAGGVMNAITAAAQVQDDADLAALCEAQAVPVMQAVAARK